RPDAAEDEEAYQAWLGLVTARQEGERSRVRRELDRLTDRPSVAVVEADSADGWNGAAAGCSADFLAFLETGDELEPGITDDVALALAASPEIYVLYTDSDLVRADGQRVRPFFKPGWSPDQLLSHPYLGRLLV